MSSRQLVEYTCDLCGGVVLVESREVYTPLPDAWQVNDGPTSAIDICGLCVPLFDNAIAELKERLMFDTDATIANALVAVVREEPTP